MTTDRPTSLRTFLRSVAALVVLAAFAGSPPAGLGQGTYSRQDRPEAMMRGPFERVASLNDLWYLQSSEKVKGAGEQISKPGFKIESWYPAIVPSTVLGTLVQNNVYTDIFVGDNLKSVPTAPFEASWWYRKEFTVPFRSM